MCFHLLWIISTINKFTFKIKMAKPICSFKNLFIINHHYQSNGSLKTDILITEKMEDKEIGVNITA